MTIQLNQEKTLITLKEYVIITIALFLQALAWIAFLIPSEIVGGGITGLSALLYFVTDVPMGIINLAFNVVLILVSIKSMGRAFGIKTAYSLIVVSFFLTILQSMITEPVVDDRFLSAVMGGILVGVSIGLIFSQGGSSGGTEIIAMMINKKYNISPARILLTFDVLIIASSYFIFHHIENIIYGYVAMGVMNYVIDLSYNGSRRSVQLFIFSKFPDKIADAIGNEIHRGVTMVKGKGWYTKNDVDIVMVVVKKKETGMVFRVIKSIDKQAFISVGNVMGVYGEGFDQLRVKSKPSKEKKKD